MTRLFLVRHGETQWNAEERFVGTSDVPLNPTGLRQAMAIAARLRAEELEAIYSSDLQRARQTAELIAAEHQLQVQQDRRLREIDYGEWEGLTREEIAEQFHTFIPSVDTHPRVRFPESGAIGRCHKQIKSLITELLERHAGDSIALVGHGVNFQLMLYTLLDIPVQKHWLHYMFNGSISEMYVHQDQAVLIRLNDTCHLHQAWPRAQ